MLFEELLSACYKELEYVHKPPDIDTSAELVLSKRNVLLTFRGSFNPVHKGHIQCINAALQAIQNHTDMHVVGVVLILMGKKHLECKLGHEFDRFYIDTSVRRSLLQSALSVHAGYPWVFEYPGEMYPIFESSIIAKAAVGGFDLQTLEVFGTDCSIRFATNNTVLVIRPTHGDGWKMFNEFPSEHWIYSPMSTRLSCWYHPKRNSYVVSDAKIRPISSTEIRRRVLVGKSIADLSCKAVETYYSRQFHIKSSLSRLHT